MSDLLQSAAPLDEEALRALAEREGMRLDGRTFGQQAWARLRKHKLALFAAGLLVLISLSFIIGPMLSPYDITQPFPLDRILPPSWAHPFGTDAIGRDLMTRTLYGGRFSLLIAVVVSVLTTLIGTIIGALSGYLGGWVDALLSQITNLFLIVPALVVLIVVSRYMRSVTGTSILLALLLWPQIARVVRGLFLQYKNQEFVLAARAAGAGPARIMFRHILPNTIGPIVVSATLLVGGAIILESTLGFLGLGVRPPTPTLGNLVNEARGQLLTRPYEVLLPGTFVVLISLCINFLGDALRDALDPTTGRG